MLRRSDKHLPPGPARNPPWEQKPAPGSRSAQLYDTIVACFQSDPTATVAEVASFAGCAQVTVRHHVFTAQYLGELPRPLAPPGAPGAIPREAAPPRAHPKPPPAKPSPPAAPTPVRPPKPPKPEPAREPLPAAPIAETVPKVPRTFGATTLPLPPRYHGAITALPPAADASEGAEGVAASAKPVASETGTFLKSQMSAKIPEADDIAPIIPPERIMARKAQKLTPDRQPLCNDPRYWRKP